VPRGPRDEGEARQGDRRGRRRRRRRHPRDLRQREAAPAPQRLRPGGRGRSREEGHPPLEPVVRPTPSLLEGPTNITLHLYSSGVILHGVGSRVHRGVPMAKPFRNLLEKLPKERRDRIEARKRRLIREINLRELRQAMELTQQQLADTLKVNQAAISKMESQSDMYISTLRRVLEAMGGTL